MEDLQRAPARCSTRPVHRPEMQVAVCSRADASHGLFVTSPCRSCKPPSTQYAVSGVEDGLQSSRSHLYRAVRLSHERAGQSIISIRAHGPEQCQSLVEQTLAAAKAADEDDPAAATAHARGGRPLILGLTAWLGCCVGGRGPEDRGRVVSQRQQCTSKRDARPSALGARRGIKKMRNLD